MSDDMKLSRGTHQLESPLIRVEACAPVRDEDMVATIHFLGRFDPTLPNPADQADPELLDALQRAAVVVQKATEIVRDLILDKAIRVAMEARRAQREVEEYEKELKH